MTAISFSALGQKLAKSSTSTTNSSTIISTATGLQYQIVRNVNGTKPKLDDEISMHYTLSLTDGTKIDNSYDANRPLTCIVSELTGGLKEALQLMSVGSKYRFILPPNLGYGAESGAGGEIPPNSTLIYDLELLDIKFNEMYSDNDDAPKITMDGIRKQNANMTAESKRQLDEVTKAQNEVADALRELTVDDNTIIAGRGWGKIVLGASKKDLESILGTSDLEAEYLSFHEKKGIFVYFSHEIIAGEISFETSIGKYSNELKAKPDKNLEWGSSASEVIKAYGTSYKKRSKDSEYGGVLLNSIIFSNIEFYFANDKLVRINVFRENDRLKGLVDSE